MKTLKPLLLIVAFAAAMSACSPKQSDTPQTTADAPVLKDTLSPVTAQRLVHNFDSRANIFHRGGITLPDSRSVWFSLKQLKALVNKIDTEQGSGIRFYFAAYDSVQMPDLTKIKPQYQNYTTLVMVSTRDSANLHFDYYYNNMKGAGKFARKGAIVTGGPENTGELCPPPATCSQVGATFLP